MDNFDQLIKKKAEQKHFEYRSTFWLAFAKKAGFASVIYTKIAFISIAAITTAAGIGYGAYRYFQQESITPQPVEIIEMDTTSVSETEMKITETENSKIDTTEIDSTPTTKVRKEKQPPIEKKNIAKKTSNEGIDSLPKMERNKELKPDTVPVKRVVKRKKYNIQPIQINPDTISSNY